LAVIPLTRPNPVTVKDVESAGKATALFVTTGVTVSSVTGAGFVTPPAVTVTDKGPGRNGGEPPVH
jgi:hypothetical protein